VSILLTLFRIVHARVIFATLLLPILPETPTIPVIFSRSPFDGIDPSGCLPSGAPRRLGEDAVQGIEGVGDDIAFPRPFGQHVAVGVKGERLEVRRVGEAGGGFGGELGFGQPVEAVSETSGKKPNKKCIEALL